jgi:hypothetical protein
MRLKRRLDSELKTLGCHPAGAEKGREWTPEVRVLLIQFVFILMLKYGANKTEACRAVAMTGRSYSRVMELVTTYWKTGEVGQGPSLQRGPIPMTADLLASQQQQVQTEMAGWLLRGMVVTARMVQTHLEVDHSIQMTMARVRWFYVGGVMITAEETRFHQWTPSTTRNE